MLSFNSQTLNFFLFLSSVQVFISDMVGETMKGHLGQSQGMLTKSSAGSLGRRRMQHRSEPQWRKDSLRTGLQQPLTPKGKRARSLSWILHSCWWSPRRLCWCVSSQFFISFSISSNSNSQCPTRSQKSCVNINIKYGGSRAVLWVSTSYSIFVMPGQDV